MWELFTADDGGLSGWITGDGEHLAVVLHGGPGLTDYTEGIGEEVLEGGDGRLRVARFQQRGQSPSAVTGSFTVAGQVADTLAVLDALGAKTAMLVGHSWGGHLAMHVAVAAPERVIGLLLIDSLGAIGDGGYGTMGRVIGARIGDAGTAALVELAALDLDPDEAATRRFGVVWPGYFKDPHSATPMPPIAASAAVLRGVLGDAMELLSARVLEVGLPPLRIPSLHMIGAHSPIEPAANEKTAELMHDSIVEILDTGHFIWIEQPGAVAAATRRLLTSTAG